MKTQIGKKAGKRWWWRDRYVTLMVVPEKTRQVHKVILPFFVLKLGVVMVSLSFVFLAIVGIDYIHVLGRIAENKRLKGENFKLRQELHMVQNKVDNMEYTMNRVRNYAKKLQVLTGQEDKKTNKKSKGLRGKLFDETLDRELSSEKKKISRLYGNLPKNLKQQPLTMN